VPADGEAQEVETLVIEGCIFWTCATWCHVSR
jgi:hypothetical protein